MTPTPYPLARWLGDEDFEAFAAAIAAAPEDQAPRLILADWLEERGDVDAGPLARGDSFPEILALARFRKASGGALEDLLRRQGELLQAAARSFADVIAPAFQRAAVAMRSIDVAALRTGLDPARRELPGEKRGSESVRKKPKGKAGGK